MQRSFMILDCRKNPWNGFLVTFEGPITGRDLTGFVTLETGIEDPGMIPILEESAALKKGTPLFVVKSDINNNKDDKMSVCFNAVINLDITADMLHEHNADIQEIIDAAQHFCFGSDKVHLVKEGPEVIWHTNGVNTKERYVTFIDCDNWNAFHTTYTGEPLAGHFQMLAKTLLMRGDLDLHLFRYARLARSMVYMLKTDPIEGNVSLLRSSDTRFVGRNVENESKIFLEMLWSAWEFANVDPEGAVPKVKWRFDGAILEEKVQHDSDRLFNNPQPRYWGSFGRSPRHDIVH